MTKLTPPVSERDHISGSVDAGTVLAEYGDYECPHCVAVFAVIEAIKSELGDRLCFVYRHYPLAQIHPYAESAAEAAESAAAQNRFWEMHNALYKHSPQIDDRHLVT